MAKVGEITVPITFEMTDTGKAVLRNAVLAILQEPDVLEGLLIAFENWQTEKRTCEVPLSELSENGVIHGNIN